MLIKLFDTRRVNFAFVVITPSEKLLETGIFTTRRNLPTATNSIGTSGCEHLAFKKAKFQSVRYWFNSKLKNRIICLFLLSMALATLNGPDDGPTYR